MEPFNFSNGHGIYIKTDSRKTTRKYTFMWKIENYSKIPLKTIEKSSEFRVEPQSTWYVELKKTESAFLFTLHRHCNVLPAELVHTLTVTDVEGKEIYMARGELPVDCTPYSRDIAWYSHYDWPDVVNSMNKSKNDCLLFTVLLEVRNTHDTEIIGCSVINEDAVDEKFQQKLLKTLSDDLKKTLHSRSKTDLVLSVQDQKIHVHQVILSARSPVFAKMLQHDGMTDIKDKVVEIDDVTMPVLSELVAFLYSGQMKAYDFQIAMDLYEAANKYELLELRELCARVLVSKMTLEDAPIVLALAHLHQDAEFKDKVMQFIKTHYMPK